MTFKINGTLLCIEDIPKGLSKEQVKKIALEKMGDLVPIFTFAGCEYEQDKYINILGTYSENNV